MGRENSQRMGSEDKHRHAAEGKDAARDERRRREIAMVLNSQGIHCTPDSTVIRNAVESHR